MSTTTIEIPSGVRISEEYGYICIRDEKGWLLWSTDIKNLQGTGYYLGTLLTDAMRADRQLPPNPRMSSVDSAN